MHEDLPDYVSQGEPARLFPVLSTTSKEGRTTSILLSCLSKVFELSVALISPLGPRIGTRARVDCFTEVVCRNSLAEGRDRPDGLIVVTIGKREWRALVEAKVGNATLEIDQIERYRKIAKDNEIDCVLTISNQFSTTPHLHPVPEVSKSRSKIPVYHWSWMHVLTQVDLLLNQRKVEDQDQMVILNELRRFLSHESAGVRGFFRMPKEWAELNRLVTNGGTVASKSAEVVAVVTAWNQETRDLSLILSRMTETSVQQRLSRKHQSDPDQRLKDEAAILADELCLHAELDVPDAAAPLKILADIRRRSVDVGMLLRAPEDKVSTKARVNWLLRQIKDKADSSAHVRLLWPGKVQDTQHSLVDILNDPTVASSEREHLAPHSFYIFRSHSLGGRFAQQANFISDLEDVVPGFYRDIGSNLTAWAKKAPRVKDDRQSAIDVSPDALSEDSEEYQG